MTDAVQLLAVMDSSRPSSPNSLIGKNLRNSSVHILSGEVEQVDPCLPRSSVKDDETSTGVRVRKRSRSAASRSSMSRPSSRLGSASPVDGAALAARASSPAADANRLNDCGESEHGRGGDLVLVQARQSPTDCKHPVAAAASYLLRPVRSGAGQVARNLTSFTLLPVRLGVCMVYAVRAWLLKFWYFLYSFVYRVLRMSVCVVTRRSVTGVDGGMPLRVRCERKPARPPRPDLSQLTDEEKQLLTTALDRLKTESEKELLRIRRAEDQLQVYATEKADVFSDFDVVCDACLQVKQCVEVPNVNRHEKLLICSDCMVPLLSGAWYHGMDTLETVNVCTDLIEKAGTPSPAGSADNSPQVHRGDGIQFHQEKPMKLLQLAETAPPSSEPVDSEEEFEAACDAIAAKRLESMSERHLSCSPSLPSRLGDGVENTTSPTESLTASQMEERKDNVPAMEVPFPSRRRPSGATEALQLQFQGSSPAAQSPITLDSESEYSDSLSVSTFGGLSEYSASDLAPGLEISQIAGQEPVGEIELGLQMGVEASKQRSSFVLDVLRGFNFKLWENLGENPGFEVYVKCYLIFPGRVIKMKTRPVAPGPQPEFLDQLISIMNKKLLQKAEHLKLQLWENHGGIKKKYAVGVATIDLTKIRAQELVMGCYPLYVPYRHASKPSTPTSPSVSVSPGSTPPSSSLTRSGSGRLGSLRNSFKRREKLRLRQSNSGTAPSSPLVAAGAAEPAALSSSAPTASSTLATTPTRRARHDSDFGETDL